MKRNALFIAFTLLIPLFIFSQSGTKYILLEEFSTAQCGFCPDGDIVAAQLVQKYPHLIWVTHHAGFGTDSMTALGSNTIANAFTTGAPMACIDRIDAPIYIYTTPPYIAISRQKWDSVCGAHYSDPAVADVNITNKYDNINRTLDCEVNVIFRKPPKPGDFRINIFLVEDSVVGYGKGYDQRNYYNSQPGHPLYGKGDTIIGYVHHRVVRLIPTGNWGVSGVIPYGPVYGAKYSHSIKNIPIPSKWKSNDMEVVAFVSYANDTAKKRQVINSNHLNLLANSTGISNLNEINKRISIYPNPTSDIISIEGDLSGNSQVYMQIFNNTGQIIRNFSCNGKTTFSVGDLENGVYFYNIISRKSLISNGNLVIIH